MYRAKIVAALMFVKAVYATQHAAPPAFSGANALRNTRSVVELGPRPIDTPAHRKMEQLIVARLKSYGCTVEEQIFTAQTPIGPKRMNNIIAKVGGRGNDLVVLSGHYDTKIMDRPFVGANDGGSSTGFLLEMARVLCGKPRKNDLYLVWLDGEEAVRTWTPEDSLYGSRHLARHWQQDGTIKRIKALINVDMIGDGDLLIVNEWNSTPALRKLVWDAAASLGLSRHFSALEGAIEDDHIPFLRAGAPALDLIDFDYGPGNSWWHTEQDTIDKLSANSFQVVGNVLLKVLAKLEN
jgi:Zn-dependent M28 family amino/carboxypeptidase